MAKRLDRHEAIREIVRDCQVKTQQELAERLSALGYRCTQATVSRDVQELGLVKGVGGGYALPEELRLQRLVSDLVTEARCAGNLVVVHTYGGSAGSLAAALDSTKYAGLLGTVAGDDTVLAVLESSENAQEMCETIKTLL